MQSTVEDAWGAGAQNVSMEICTYKKVDEKFS